MFQILSGASVIHNPLMSLENRVAISPVLTRELNRQGSLEFSIAPVHPMYDSLTS